MAKRMAVDERPSKKNFIRLATPRIMMGTPPMSNRNKIPRSYKAVNNRLPRKQHKWLFRLVRSKRKLGKKLSYLKFSVCSVSSFSFLNKTKTFYCRSILSAQGAELQPSVHQADPERQQAGAPEPRGSADLGAPFS